MGSRSRRRERAEATSAPAKRKPAKARAAKEAPKPKPKPAEKAKAKQAPPRSDPLARGYARGRERDEAIRESLEPLAPGERPTAVTVAAIVAALLAVANVGAGLIVSDVEASQIPIAVIQGVVLLVAAVGMWKAKYWAVLGFEALLAIQILVLTLALLTVESILYAVGVTVVIGLLGYLFFKLVRAMARLQMPERPAR